MFICYLITLLICKNRSSADKLMRNNKLIRLIQAHFTVIKVIRFLKCKVFKGVPCFFFALNFISFKNCLNAFIFGDFYKNFYFSAVSIYPLTISAFFLPIRLSISSKEASLIFLTDLKCFKSFSAVFSPIPSNP